MLTLIDKEENGMDPQIKLILFCVIPPLTLLVLTGIVGQILHKIKLYRIATAKNLFIQGGPKNLDKALRLFAKYLQIHGFRHPWYFNYDEYAEEVFLSSAMLVPIKEIVDALNRKEPEIRFYAARVLEEYKKPETIKHLIHSLRNETSVDVAKVMISAIEKLDSKQAIPLDALERLMASEKQKLAEIKKKPHYEVGFNSDVCKIERNIDYLQRFINDLKNLS